MSNEKDITEKMLLEYNDIFADIFNVLLFDGERLIQEDELSATGARSQIKIDGKIHDQERDVAKFWSRFGVRLAIFGVENQTDPDEDMPLRCFSYDGASYKTQVNQRRSADKMKKLPVYPAVTIVLNFSSRRWSEPKTLFECFGPDIPEHVKAYANDYRIHVFDIAWMSLEEIQAFQSDFRFVAEFFVRNRTNTLDEMSDERIQHAHEVLTFLEAVLNDRRFDELTQKLSEKGGDRMPMTDVVDQLLAKGELRGIAKGEANGIAKGKAEGKVEGKIEGRAEGIVITVKSLGKSRTEAVAMVSTFMNLSKEEAEKQVQELWDTV